MNTQKPVFNRPISATESSFINLNELYSPMVLQIIIEGKGEINEAEFCEAVQKSADACPGIRLIKNKNTWIDSEETPAIYFQDEIKFDGYNFNECEIFSRIMDPKSNTVEIFYCRKPQYIIFRAFHGICDSKGLMLWIDNIFRYLNNESLVEAKSIYTDSEILKSQPTVSFKSNLKLNHSTGKKYSTSVGPVFWKRLNVIENYTAVVAKISKAIAEYSEQNSINFLIPVDLRRHMPLINSTANNTLPIYLNVNKGETWEIIYGKLLYSLKEKTDLNKKSLPNYFVSNLPVWVQLLGIRIVKFLQDLKGKFMVGGVISHIGKVDLKKWSTNSFQAITFYSLPTQQPFTPIIINISESINKTEIVLATYHEFISETEAEIILGRIKNMLKQ